MDWSKIHREREGNKDHQNSKLQERPYLNWTSITLWPRYVLDVFLEQSISNLDSVTQGSSCKCL